MNITENTVCTSVKWKIRKFAERCQTNIRFPFSNLGDNEDDGARVRFLKRVISTPINRDVQTARIQSAITRAMSISGEPADYTAHLSFPVRLTRFAERHIVERVKQLAILDYDFGRGKAPARNS